MRVPSMPPWRTSATSVVPPPTSTNSAPGLLDLFVVHASRDGVRLGDDRDQLQVEHARDGLQRAQMDQRRKRVEDADAHVTAVEADRIGHRVAVDRGAGDRGMDEADVDVGQARLPRHGSFRLAQRVLLDRRDERVELARA